LDNLTHTLTGVMLARAGLKRFSPRGTLLLAMAANSPDIDVVSWFGGPVTYLEYHRWITHALAAAPLIALLPVAIIRMVHRKPIPWFRAFAISLVAVLSHLALDFTNVYGVRLLLPFSGRWLRLDITSVIDVWIWIILLFALAAPALARLVSNEIGAKENPGRGWAIFALALIGAYDFGRYLAHERALAMLDARVYRSEAPTQTAAFPSPANPFHWTGLVELSEAYVMLPVGLPDDFDPTRGRVLFKTPRSAAMEAAAQTQPFRVFLDFSAFPLWQTTPAPEPETATRVDVFDLRFGNPDQPGFNASALVDASNRVLKAQFGFGRLQPR
jgi:inner membrane protein